MVDSPAPQYALAKVRDIRANARGASRATVVGVKAFSVSVAASVLVSGLVAPVFHASEANASVGEPVTIERANEILYQAYEVSNERAEAIGGYSYKRSSTYSDGGRTFTDARFWVDSSVEFHEYYYDPERSQPSSTVEYVWDAAKGKFVFPAVTQRAFDAYELLGADRDSWLAQDLDAFYGDSMHSWLGMPTAQAELVFFDLSPSLAQWNPTSGVLRFSGVDKSTGKPSTVDISLDEQGSITRVNWVGSWYDVSTVLTYLVPDISIPMSPPPVSWKDYSRAIQTIEMKEVLDSLSTMIVNHPDVLKGKGLRPRKVSKVAQQVVKRARTQIDLALPIKIKRTKSGAKLIARNVFTGKKTTVKYVLVKPYPSNRIDVK